MLRSKLAIASTKVAVADTIHSDPWENLMEVHALFDKRLGIDTTEAERKLIRRLAELVGTRAARLSACGVAAICKKKGYTSCHVGADGSVFNKYPHFQERGAQALREIFGENTQDKSAHVEYNTNGRWIGWGDDVKEDPVQIVPAEDGSGVGAALIAALTLNVHLPYLLPRFTVQKANLPSYL